MSLRYLPLWQGLGLLWIGLVVYLSLMPSPAGGSPFPGADKLVHALVYAALGAWYGALFPSWAGRSGVLVVLIALGGGLELAQGMSPSRHTELADLVADALGVVTGVALARLAVSPALRRLDARLP